jgi:hypothetical protein
MTITQDSLSALEKLRNEVDELTANASSTSERQLSTGDWTLLESEVGRTGALAAGLDGVLRWDDSLQTQIDELKRDISSRVLEVQEYVALTSARQVSCT